ncbi:type II secretion system F family protein [Paenibacillus thailandensis]|uniref:Type II secretion system F family protein n=1 Tax=Paenibacillus thailandensis TaxID=393250 RepID=A0ABW5QSW6_9BACL
MLNISIAAAMVLLAALVFVVIYRLMVEWTRRTDKRSRLAYRANNAISRRMADRLREMGRLHTHLSDLLETLQLNMQPLGFVFLSFMLLLGGIAAGGLFFQSAKGVLLIGAVAALLPYTVLRAMLVQRRQRAQHDFLPAVELFYQCYLVTGGRQVRVALQRTIEERRLIGPMQPVFEQLYRNLSVRDDDDTSLRLFSAAVGSVWGDYFANLLRVSLSEGISIADGLKELITDMRKARRANEQERNKLLEIRIANFSPVFFLALFIGINCRFNGANAYHYYVVDPHGRDLLLNAVMLIFVSFLMGLWLSRKKM